MIFKMLGIELANRRTHFANRPRQMFLTQSHVLARRVAEYYTQLLHATEFQHVNTHQTLPAEEDLLDFDEDDDERDDLPAKFSDLEDKHFPLFATFDQASVTCNYLLLASLMLQMKDSSYAGNRSWHRILKKGGYTAEKVGGYADRNL
jgi:hypothetical protein